VDEAIVAEAVEDVAHRTTEGAQLENVVGQLLVI